jgi:hypothetical protein
MLDPRGRVTFRVGSRAKGRFLRQDRQKAKGDCFQGLRQAAAVWATLPLKSWSSESAAIHPDIMTMGMPGPG